MKLHLLSNNFYYASKTFPISKQNAVTNHRNYLDKEPQR